MVLENAHLNLYRLLQEIEALMSVEVAKKGLSFELEQSSDLPQYINIDPGKLRQVLLNLIGNAIKFTDSGGIVVRTSIAEPQLTQGIKLQFEVEDSGIGICEEDKERIFSPFKQTGDKQSVGTGLGLTISKQYIELMGGKITVSSVLKKGTVFRFDIPVESLPLSEDDTAPKLRHERVIGLAKGQPQYRLLITEDKMENRLLLHKLLEPLSFKIREAVNGAEAVEIFAQWHPHLIWMDIRMPVMDGLEATQRIKASESGTNTKIIALTAHALEDERREILAAGCDDFIRKPYRDTEIFEALAKHLSIHFLYSEEPATTNNVIELNENKLKQIPVKLLKKLHEAGELLNEELCLEMAGMISDYDHELGQKLRQMVENMQYKELLAILDSLSLH